MMTLTQLPIFVVGDSRTGTLALHNFFVDNGFTSLHYYIKQAKQIEPLHEHIEENREQLRTFLEDYPVQCYTDYPTRFFFVN